MMDKTFATNYYGVRYCVDAFLGTMRPNGRVVVTSSCVGQYSWNATSAENQGMVRSIKSLSEMDELAQQLIA